MASQDSNNNDLAYADTLWKSADALRGQVDAAEYKHVVLGLLFLKYISDAFAARREGLMAELEADGITGAQMESLLESRDEYTAERVFWVPPEARWQNLQNQAIRPDIATLIDDAILAVERDNPNLKGKLPRDYARRSIAPEKLKGLIDLIADIGFKGGAARARDSLGRVYEYFLGKFAQAEGKLGGEFFTPRCIVRLLVEMLEPYEGRVYDPCCGSAGMFVQSERFVEAHGGQTTDISIFGQESNPTTWRLAHMNLAIRGIEANLGSQPADTFLRDLHPDLKTDDILGDSASLRPGVYSDIPGFCKAETIDGIRKHGFVLTPGRYVGAEEQEEDSEPFEEKYPRLLAELEACFVEGERLMGVVRERLQGVGNG
ncbi:MULTISPECIES: N-6 DNA methylase [unclassified Thiocapsa]|uniref:N-6 DNA methylase n=1 Tax=unclassified Thiocapsa TaxID=2641286 RepID=UPI0035ADE033